MALSAAATPPARKLGEGPVAALVFLLIAFLPLLSEGYVVYILPQYMLFGVMAMSLALLWGQTGVLSFGQAGFFAIGGYGIGVLMSHELPVNPAYVGIIVGVVLCVVVSSLFC